MSGDHAARERFARMSFALTGSRRGGGGIIDVHGGNTAIKVVEVLFEDGNWGQVRVRAESSLDPQQWHRNATIRYHPTQPRRLLVVIVDGSEQWSVLRNVNGPVSVAEAARAAVRLVAQLPLAEGQRLDPIEGAEVEVIFARPERIRMVGCDCGGLRLRVPHGGTFCWREKIDPQRRHRVRQPGDARTWRERIVRIIERLTFGLI